MGRFIPWPEAVQFLFRTYAKDQYIEYAVDKMDRLFQRDTEDVMEFYRRLTKHARDLGGVFSQNELMNLFQRGLQSYIRALRRSACKSFTVSNALADFSDHDVAISASRLEINEKARPARARALLVDEEPENLPLKL